MNWRNKMKFLHVADLHLGKTLNQESLIHLQKEALDQIIEVMKQRSISTLIIAGDVYDRPVPSLEAVNLFDAFLYTLIIENHFQVYMITGNHDSSDRLHFASSLLEKQGLHIESYLSSPLTCYELEDEYGKIYIHLCPFSKPSAIAKNLSCDGFKNYQEAFSSLLEKEHQYLDHSSRHILVAHQFVGGIPHIELSDSELPLSVGGSEMIDYSLFDDFDYVALGHLHAPQKIKYETIRYSGSLLKYAFSEAYQQKSFTYVELLEKGKVNIEEIPIQVSQDVRIYQGYFRDFMDNRSIVSNPKDYIAFNLLDDMMIPSAMEQLKTHYPHALQLSYAAYTKLLSLDKPVVHLEEMDPFTLFQDFFNQMLDRKPDEQQKEMIYHLIGEAGDSDAN